MSTCVVIRRDAVTSFDIRFLIQSRGVRVCLLRVLAIRWVHWVLPPPPFPMETERHAFHPSSHSPYLLQSVDHSLTRIFHPMTVILTSRLHQESIVSTIGSRTVCSWPATTRHLMPSLLASTMFWQQDRCAHIIMVQEWRIYIYSNIYVR